MTYRGLNIPIGHENTSQSDDEECATSLFATPPQSPLPSPAQEHSSPLAGDYSAVSAIQAGPEHVNNVENPSTEHEKVVAKEGSSSTTAGPASECQRRKSVATGISIRFGSNTLSPSSDVEVQSSKNERLSVTNNSDAGTNSVMPSSPSDDGLLLEAAGGEPASDVHESPSYSLHDVMAEDVRSRRNLSFSKSPDHLHVAGGSGLVSSDQSLLYSPTPDHLSVAFGADLVSSGQSLQASPLPEQDQSQAHRQPRQGGLPGKESQQSGDTELKKSDKGKRAQKNRKKNNCPEDGNVSTTATSSSESTSMQPQCKKSKNGFRHRFRSSMPPFLRKKSKPATSTDYKDSSNSSVSWNMSSGTQISSSDSAIGISPSQFVNAVTLRRSSLDEGAHVLSQLVLPQGQLAYMCMPAICVYLCMCVCVGVSVCVCACMHVSV